MNFSRQTCLTATMLTAVFCFYVTFFSSTTVCYAASSVLEMHTEDAENVTWQLTADTLVSHNNSKIVEARGKVALRRGSDYLKADFARYYATTNWVYLQGNVEIFTGADTIEASEAEFDLRNKTGWMKDGKIFMEGPHIYFAGERITKKWGDYYVFQNATVTTCPPDAKAWSLSADQAVVEIDGYAQLFSSTFDVADNSFIYTPYMLMPAKKSRQSGFLTPEYGISKRRGAYYNQPYYWVIDDTQDITFNEYWMEKKGFMHGVEYRSRETSEQATWLRADFLWDKHLVTNDADDDVLNDGYIRTNHGRYWLRGMSDGHFGNPEWKYKLNIDYVSDQNYLREFDSGMVGFDHSRNQLFNLFGRDLQEIDRNRVSEGMVYRDWDRASVALSARYEQNPIYGHGNPSRSEDTTAQRLPQFDAFFYKGRIIESLPIEVEAAAQTVYFHREKGAQGLRTDFHPSVSIPFVTRYGSVITSMGWRQTLYNTERGGVVQAEDKGTSNDYRSLPDYHIEAFTEVGRVWPLAKQALTTADTVGSEHWESVYHRIQPRVEYTYLPYENQSRLPYYSAEDRILPINELRYSVTNILTRKRAQVVMAQSGDNPDVQAPQVQYDYLDVIRWRLESGYDIREDRRDDELDRYERRPFLDIISDLTVNPYHWLGFQSRAFLSSYLGTLTRYDQTINLTNSEWGWLNSGYSYRRKIDEYTRYREREYNLFTISGELNIGGPWSIGGHYYYDLEDNEGYEYTLDIAYTHPCYRLVLQYTSDYYDQGVSLMIELPGLTD